MTRRRRQAECPISIRSPVSARCSARLHLHAVDDTHRGIQDDAVAGLEAGADLDRGAVVALQVEMAQRATPSSKDGGAEAVLVEDHAWPGMMIVGAWRGTLNRTLQ
jgi:hypothetical protein